MIDSSRKLHPDKILVVVAVSLDTDINQLKKNIENQQLFDWVHYSELKGLNGSVHKLYNVYATPMFYLLDSDKKIIESAYFIEKVLYPIWEKKE